MTRFVYIADSHLGSADEGYKLQPKYGDKLPEIIDALDDWIREDGKVDFILHGGDMVHVFSQDSLDTARGMFERSVPVYLCVGNHDLTEKGCIEQWLEAAPEFFPEESADFAIRTDDCVIHVVPSQWDETPYFWGEAQNVHLLESQVEFLERGLESDPDKVHVIQTHSPVLGIGTSQTGLDELFHAPPALFTETVTRIAERHGVACVLGAHTHANMNEERNGVNYVTVSSLVEAPFEFKLFEIDSGTFSMTTHSLWDRVGFEAEYNWNQTFVQGRACDRSFIRRSEDDH